VLPSQSARCSDGTREADTYKRSVLHDGTGLVLAVGGGSCGAGGGGEGVMGAWGGEQVMAVNIERILDRGEKIELLVDRTADLQEQVLIAACTTPARAHARSMLRTAPACVRLARLSAGARAGSAAAVVMVRARVRVRGRRRRGSSGPGRS
jgi:hypothetical protein